MVEGRVCYHKMAAGKKLNEASKEQFYKELRKLETGDSLSDRDTAKKIRAAAEKISCFYCLDYEVVYKDREGMFSNLDFRGDYDIINCLVCKGNEDWIKCSSGPESQYPGIVKRGTRERMWLEGKATGVMESLVDKLKAKIESA